MIENLVRRANKLAISADRRGPMGIARYLRESSTRSTRIRGLPNTPTRTMVETSVRMGAIVYSRTHQTRTRHVTAGAARSSVRHRQYL